MSEFSNRDDIIDSRDIIARIEELQNELDGLVSDAEEAPAGTEDAAQAAAKLAEWKASDDGAELVTLLALQDEAEGSPDWEYGETLIRDDYFKEYAQQLADDIGAIPKDLSWPCNCIDWDQAARELKHDYFSVEFSGVTYWIRN